MFPTEGPYVYGDSQFKFVINDSINGQRKHVRGNWVKNGNNDYWTSDGTVKEDTATRVVLNPVHENLRDFAYYGSAVQLIEGSVRDVINRFPAEIYFNADEGAKIKVDGKSYFVADNDYLINIYDATTNGEDVNELRYFCRSFGEYNLVDTSGTTEPITEWEVERYNKGCKEREDGAIIAKVTLAYGSGYTGGDFITLYAYVQGVEEYVLFTEENLNGFSLRPNDSHTEDFFQSLDIFESFMLNRKTNPLYAMSIETPTETDEGFFYTIERHIWPNKNNWNPDITSAAYNSYLDELLRIARYYDEYDTDNIWRSMTHEAIKALDWTFSRTVDSTTYEYENIDTTRIEPILKLYGRQYDDIKQYIDAIKRIKRISYSKNGDAPDYFISDSLNLSGWETINVNPSHDDSITAKMPYDGMDGEINSSEANIEFLRRLKLCSRYILSTKGTRKAVDTVLAMFGFKPNEYDIDEYVVVAKGNVDDSKMPIYKDIVEDNEGNVSATTMVWTGETTQYYPLYDEVAILNKHKDTFNVVNDNNLSGIPVAQVEGHDGLKAYVIPWFERGKQYDKALWFQMAGGWGRAKERYINSSLTSKDKLIDDRDHNIYDENESNLKFVGDIDGMLELGNNVVKTGDICYVTDISDLQERYHLGEDEDISNASHYFVLKSAEWSAFLGCHDAADETYGWKSISIDDIENTRGDGWTVVYLETLNETTTGNAPHIGQGMYDSGQSYLDRMGNFFSASEFTETPEDVIEAIEDYKFVLSKPIIDNKKCWYFGYDYGDTETLIKKDDGTYVPTSAETIDEIAINNYDPETNEDKVRTEASANSIINIKKFVISFATKKNEYLQRYINDVVLPYITQIIPSTTLFEVDIKGDGSFKASAFNLSFDRNHVS